MKFRLQFFIVVQLLIIELSCISSAAGSHKMDQIIINIEGLFIRKSDETTVPPVFKAAQWCNNDLIVNTNNGLILINTKNTTWKKLVSINNDSIVVDFIVNYEKNVLLYSIIINPWGITKNNSMYNSAIYLKSINVLNSALPKLIKNEVNAITHNLLWFTQDSCTYIRRTYVQWQIDTKSPIPYIAYHDKLVIQSLTNTISHNYGFVYKTSICNDTLCIWSYYNSDSLFPKFYNVRSIDNINMLQQGLFTRIANWKPLPGFESSIFTAISCSLDSLVLVNINTGKKQAIYIGQCDDYTISNNDSLVATLTNITKETIFSRIKNMMHIVIMDVHNEINSAISSIKNNK